MCPEREIVKSYEWSALWYNPVLSGTCPARNVDAPSGFELRSSAVAISRIIWSHLPTAGNSGSSSPSTVVLCVRCCLLSVCRSVRTYFAVCTQLSVIIVLYHQLLIQNLLEKNSSFFSSKTWILNRFVFYLFIFLFAVALRPNTGHGLLLLDVSRSHTTTHHSR